MDDFYCVSLMDGSAGQVKVSKEGLYYRFSCRIPLKNGMKYKLYACQNMNRIGLGLFVPEGNEFVLSAKVPVKRFTDGEVTFHLMDRDELDYFPVRIDEPFPCLNRLNDGFFAVRGGVPVIMWNPQPLRNP